MSAKDSMPQTPAGSRLHISFFGRCNVGKSSLINALCAQEVSLVSPERGTTSDPVRKSMELLPLGPVVLTDTAGLDEGSALGGERSRRSLNVLRRTDLAVLVLDKAGLLEEDQEFLAECRRRGNRVLAVLNEGAAPVYSEKNPIYPENMLRLDAYEPEDIERLKKELIRLLADKKEEPRLLEGLIGKKDLILFVAPIDSSAPKGRLILPQVQALRDALDWHGISMLLQPEELPEALALLKEPPAVVVCDSQVFGKVKTMLPEEQPLTSFSILFARLKGILETAVQGAFAAGHLKRGAKVLIAEGCTHHRQCEDIGTVKLPNWLEDFCGVKLDFDFVSGGDFPASLKKYDLVVHCGGCMLNAREVLSRSREAKEQGVPFTNYGILIAHVHGILKRSIAPFGL